ncbi:BsaWI family type II restriction enzyme [Halobacillus trueperi]|uniref:BsaWI family type II restriction enzyme n=1 Tax=Halobacillus trueperi TaxID=156205 RepID=UPI0037351BAD
MNLWETTQAVYDSHLLNLCGFDRHHPSNPPSNISRCRRQTISKTMEKVAKDFPDLEPSQIWKNIEKAHITNYISGSITLPNSSLDASGIISYLLNGDTLKVFNSAGQSWKRASGVAWEDFIKTNLFLSNEDVEIKILTPVEMNSLLQGETLKNNNGDPRGLAIPNQDEKSKLEYERFLSKVLNDKNFDLFLVYYVPFTKQWRLFGLIQCKTSIRDRIKINMKSSEEAMSKNLWSIVIAMDSDSFTKSGQYNRAAKESWNGFYVLDNEKAIDESIIYGNLFHIQEAISNHCNQVIETLIMDTQSIHPLWRPKNN